MKSVVFFFSAALAVSLMMRAALADARRVVLDNGLIAILKTDTRAPVVSVQVWVKTGSIHEVRTMGAGLSHILEHMLFKGTTTRGVARFAQEVEEIGGSTNAYTSWDRTVYYIDAPADGNRPGTDHGVMTALEILADAIQNSTLDPVEYEKEMNVVLNEWRMGRDNPDRRAMQLLYSTAYTTHPYRHPVIGYKEVYEKFGRDHAMEYYRSRYAPNNMFVVVVGDIQADRVEAKIRELFGSYERKAIAPVYVPSEPPQTAPRRRDEEMQTLALSRVHIAFHTVDARHPDAPALDILAIIAGDGRSARLYRELREKRRLVHNVNAWSITPQHSGLFGVSLVTDSDKRNSAEEAALAELGKFGAFGVRREELQRAIHKSLAKHLSSRKTMRGQADDLAEGELIADDIHFFDRYLEALRRVTVEDIRRVAKKYLVERNRTIVTLNPPGTITRVSKFSERPAELEIQKIELTNGLRVLIREDPRLPFVNFVAVVQSGLLTETEQTNGITALMASTIVKGTHRRTAEQIADQIESVGGSIGASGGSNSFSVFAEVLSEHFDLGFEIWSDVLLNPVFPAPAVERERQTQLAAITAQQERIMTVANQALRRMLYKAHPYRFDTLGTESSVSKLTPEQLRAHHAAWCAPNNMVISIFGDVNAQRVRAAIEKKLARWQAQTPNFPSHEVLPLRAMERREVRLAKEQAVLLVGFHGIDFFSPDRDALAVLTEALSGMGSRLFLRLREELGLCYYTGAVNAPDLRAGMYFFYVGTTPDRVGECEVEILKQIARLREEPLLEEELVRAQSRLLGSHIIGLQSNASLAAACALDELYGLGYQHYKTFPERIRAVTIEQVQAAARRYLVPEKRAVVVVQREPQKE